MRISALFCYFLFAAYIWSGNVVAYGQPFAPSTGSPYPVLTSAVIRSIRIEVLDIFDHPEQGVFYETINEVKISTKEEIVRRELLLKVGDAYDPFLVAESERRLRELSFIREIAITVSGEGNQVDLLVRVRDTWTLYPFINLSLGSGSDKEAVGLVESNAFGYGKRLAVLQAKDEDRDKTELIWDDRRFLGSRQQLTLGHFQRSDGRRSAVTYGQPFRGLVENEAWLFRADVFDLVGRLFENGDESYIYRQQHTSLSGWYTISKGDPEQFLRRYSVGYEIMVDEFQQADADDYNDVNLDQETVSNDRSLLADDRTFMGPFIGYQQLEPDFISMSYIDRFDWVEDYNLGHDFNTRLHLAPTVFGSEKNSLILGLSQSEGWRFSPSSFLRGGVGATGRLLEMEGANSLLWTGELKYFNVLGDLTLAGISLGKHTLAFSSAVDQGGELDKDFQLVLGSGNGLRGYEDREFTGSSSVLFNLEDRFHLFYNVLQLVNIGGAVFFDAGGVGVNGPADVLSDSLYSNFGIGLRIGLPRSSGGTVVRIDLAFPLRESPDGSPAFEPRILFSTGQAFSARLKSEAQNSETTKLSYGFIQ